MPTLRKTHWGNPLPHLTTVPLGRQSTDKASSKGGQLLQSSLDWSISYITAVSLWRLSISVTVLLEIYYALLAEMELAGKKPVP